MATMTSFRRVYGSGVGVGPSPPKRSREGERNGGGRGHLFYRVDPSKDVDVVDIISPEDEDIVFIVGQDKVKVSANRETLMRKSPVFASMFSNRWEEGAAQKDKKVAQIEIMMDLPQGIGVDVEGFKAFLEGIYMDKVNKNVSLDVGLQVLKLGDMYDIQKLITSSETVISSNMTNSNVVDVFQSTNLIWRSSISQWAFKYLKRFFPLVVNVNGHLGMSVETWEQLLKCDDIHEDVEEIDLFEGLMEWRDFENSRGENFQHLLGLIRFPLMRAEQFSKYVVPTQVLPTQTVIDILCYFANNGSSSNIPRLDFVPRTNVRIAKNSVELNTLLQSEYITTDSIQLLEGTIYEIRTGFCFMKQLSIRGMGETTVLKPVAKASDGDYFDSNGGRIIFLRMFGQDSSISHLKLQATTDTAMGGKICIHVDANYCKLNNILSDGCSIILSSRRNQVQNVKFSNCRQACLDVSWAHNQLDNITCSNSSTGVVLRGVKNELNGLSCENVKTGVEIHGENQVVKNIKFLRNPNQEDYNAYICIKMYNGRKNCVSNVECNGLVGIPRTYALVMRTEEDNDEISDHFIRNVECGRIVVIGSDHTLTNVDAGDRLSVSGICHKLMACKAEQAVYHGDDEEENLYNYMNSVKLDDCNFTLTRQTNNFSSS